MTKKEKSILTEEDWGVLLPGKEVVLGNTSITIRPLNIKDFSLLTSKVTSAVMRIQKFKITWDVMSDPTKFSQVVNIIVKEAPEIISILTTVPTIDIVRLPLSKNVELAAIAWELNMADQETLVKNLQSVANMVQQLTGMLNPETVTQDSEEPPKS